MRLLYRAFFLACGVLIVTSFAERITITGRLITKDSLLFSGATVVLKNAGLSTVSSDSGTFILKNDVTGISGSRRSEGAIPPSLERGVLSFSLESPAQPVTVDLFSPDGTLIDRIFEKTLGAGVHKIDLLARSSASKGTGLVIAKLTTGNSSSVFRFLKLSGINRAGLGNMGTRSIALAKTVGAAVDTLIIWKSGYIDSVRVPVENYVASLGDIIVTLHHRQFTVIGKTNVTGNGNGILIFPASLKVDSGVSLTFYFYPPTNPPKTFDSLTVNGVRVTSGIVGDTAYTLAKIARNDTVCAWFSRHLPKTYTLTGMVNDTAFGTKITPTSTLVDSGKSQTFFFKSGGKSFDSLTVNGVRVTSGIIGDTAYTLANVTKNSTVCAWFTLRVIVHHITPIYTVIGKVNITLQEGGYMTPMSALVDSGKSQTFNFKAQTERFDSLTVNGKRVTSGIIGDTAYTLTNVSGDDTVCAWFTFQVRVVTIQYPIYSFSNDDSLGTITPSGVVYVTPGESQVFQVKTKVANCSYGIIVNFGEYFFPGADTFSFKPDTRNTTYIEAYFEYDRIVH
jgi:hypothetical protein